MTGEPETAQAVNPGYSSLYYVFDAEGVGTLHRYLDGYVAYDNGDGTVRPGGKGQPTTAASPSMIERLLDVPSKVLGRMDGNG